MVVVGLGRGGLRHGGYGSMVGRVWWCNSGLWVVGLFGCCVCVFFIFGRGVGVVGRGGAVVGYGLWVLFGCCVCVFSFIVS